MRLLIKLLVAIEIAAILIVGFAVTRTYLIPRKHAPVSRQPSRVLNPKVIERAKSWTVLISNEGFEQKFRGTGMLVDATHVLTANHMVSTNGNEMWIYVYPGRKVVHAKPILQDSKNDIAILETDEKVELSAYAIFQEKHYSGEPIVIIGNILGGMKWFVSYGVISGDWGDFVLMDGTMTHGDSGGPWINANGEVVGLSDWELDNEDGSSYVKGGIAIGPIKRLLAKVNKEHLRISTEATTTYVVRYSDGGAK